MGISVKSHMSSLDEETVDRVKAELFGAQTQDVEVTRVKSTVIRRRKKPVEAKADIEAEPLKEVTSLESRVKEKPVEKKVAAGLKPAKALKPKKSRKKEIPAKIIKMPVTPEKRVEIEPKREPEPKPEPELKPANTPAETTEVSVKEHKKKVGKKKPVEEVKDRKFFKKKISFRKKEIVEGKNLYATGYPGRKGRKGAKGKTATYGQKPLITIPKAIKRRIKIDDAVVVSDLAKRMGVKASEIIKKLMSLGVMATVNHAIDFDTSAIVAAEFNYEAEQAPSIEKLILKTKKDDPDKLIFRPPVVTVMGHVDHGKTSLLDVIRKTNVIDTEAGGITQHIGAYCVSIDKDQIIFLDTPGHEAFSAMRARGAKVTDIAILVVAADDGVMPQTIEAVNHSKVAGVPIIVAVNKIDKPGADPERVKRELADLGLVPEDWGGDVFFINVSAKENRGINNLLEMILLQAELLELKANPDKLSNGHVIEAKIDPGRGAVATVLVQEGTLRVGDSVVCGIHHGKVRAILNDRGQMIKSAGPSMPVEVVGLSGVPDAGDDFIALSDDKNAKQVSLHRIQEQRSRELAKTGRLSLSLEKLYETMQESEIKELNLIIKTDVQGSIEALADSLTKLSNDEVKINIIHAATGAISESDISLAAVSKAIIIGFNVRSTPKVQAYANEENVDIRYHKIIYNVIKEIKDAILGMMSSAFEERILGRAEIREVFHIPKTGKIGGCYVTDGKVERGISARILRDSVICYDGKISSLHRFKDDAKEV
ncbi:MAG: translation initiation factor IF-2, partial [Spirochaetales bacterium]|nr:translation initiation factor IF-2 [Spirochaetales bacterium]